MGRRHQLLRNHDFLTSHQKPDTNILYLTGLNMTQATRRTRTPWLHAFQAHRGGAKFRGIEFKLTFEQWLDIWKKSKRLSRRGNKKGEYVMARFGDQGAYEAGNVKIILFANNVREAKAGKPRHDLAAFNRSRVGIPLSEKHRAKISAWNNKGNTND